MNFAFYSISLLKGKSERNFFLFQLKKDREEEEEKKRAEAEAKSAIRQKKVDQTPKVYKSGIGKYINPSLM